ncbi:2'-5' RNA ligase family protein [Paenibacillus cymbidii]|uniref:2'-5' RNA ligase family protein n=1 Tax=Paenibacillus cymbidii TaxID=1639034 RepID=UPI001F2C30E0|nr:2'-5' RNA ligase family protein [Paenibacillus cymbidii]
MEPNDKMETGKNEAAADGCAKRRCIMIFPSFENLAAIEEIRSKHDPLFGYVGAHVTLVFPFCSDIATEALRRNIETAVAGVKPFRLVMQGISGAEGGYLFLDVAQGGEELSELHRRLYTGMLQSYYPPFLRETPYVPHLTVGRINDRTEWQRAVHSYRSIKERFEQHTVKEISVEVIDEQEYSAIEMIIPLG